jgi:hypothetical protein
VIELRRLRLVGHVARMGEMKNAYAFVVGKAECKRQHGRHRCRWEDNIRIHLTEMGV